VCQRISAKPNQSVDFQPVEKQPFIRGSGHQNHLSEGLAVPLVTVKIALEPQSGHLHNGTLNDLSRETTRFGEGQLSQERTQFPETSVKKTDGCLQPLAVRRKWHLPADQS